MCNEIHVLQTKIKVPEQRSHVFFEKSKLKVEVGFSKTTTNFQNDQTQERFHIIEHLFVKVIEEN